MSRALSLSLIRNLSSLATCGVVAPVRIQCPIHNRKNTNGEMKNLLSVSYQFKLIVTDNVAWTIKSQFS